MKRMLLILLLLFISVSGTAFATDVGTCVESPTWSWFKDWQNKEIGHVMTLKCTCNGSGALSVTLPTTIMDKLSGQMAIDMKVKPGSPAPKDGSDLEFTDSDSLSILGANGTNIVDNTSTLSVIGYNTHLGTNKYMLFIENEPVVVSITQNDVAGSVVYIKLYLIPLRY